MKTRQKGDDWNEKGHSYLPEFFSQQWYFLYTSSPASECAPYEADQKPVKWSVLRYKWSSTLLTKGYPNFNTN